MDILNKMTKEEIIHWVRAQRAYVLHPPKMSALLWSRWEIETKKVSTRREAIIKRGESLNMTKRDEYAKQFNATKCSDKRLLLLEKMKPYEKKWQAYISEIKAIQEADKKLDALYKKIERERQKETEASAR